MSGLIGICFWYRRSLKMLTYVGKIRFLTKFRNSVELRKKLEPIDGTMMGN